MKAILTLRKEFTIDFDDEQNKSVLSELLEEAGFKPDSTNPDEIHDALREGLSGDLDELGIKLDEIDQNDFEIKIEGGEAREICQLLLDLRDQLRRHGFDPRNPKDGI